MEVHRKISRYSGMLLQTKDPAPFSKKSAAFIIAIYFRAIVYILISVLQQPLL
jgi:hypothetical protein